VDSEIRLVASLDDAPGGIGALVLREWELRACYVSPGTARKGVGSALVREIERIATEHGLTHLRLSSSLTAEPFYAALGYQTVARRDHVLRTGVRMAAVQMQKALDAAD
jgi:putative acetyltransferase